MVADIPHHAADFVIHMHNGNKDVVPSRIALAVL
jgi:hypothetical protein